MEMVLLITVREAVSLLHRTPARSTSSLRKYVTKKPKQAPCVVSVSAFSNILNEVYSERSCLICVLNNKAPTSLRYLKKKFLSKTKRIQKTNTELTAGRRWSFVDEDFLIF